MRGAVMHGPGEVRVEDREAPQIVEPTDAIIRVSAACVCGSDLWPYRGIGVEDSMWPMPMGHEYAGIVEEIGDAVTTVKPGQFVVGSFWASDNTCPVCRSGYQSACVDRVPMGALGAQADLLRVPLADGTLVATPDIPSDDLIPSLVAASDVLGTGCSVPWPPRPDRARPSPWSATARSGCSRCWRPSSSALSGSSP
jgi:threonine dehydrogenase-like Zn-dependent dehydrogenase